MNLDTHAPQTLGHPPEVLVAGGTDLQLVEPEKTVQQDDGVARLRPAAREPDAAEPAVAAKPEQDAGRGEAPDGCGARG